MIDLISKSKEKRQRKSYSIPQKLIDEIKKIAKKRGVKQSVVAEQLMTNGLTEYRKAEKKKEKIKNRSA